MELSSLVKNITKYGVVISYNSQVFANKKALELLNLRKRTIFNDLKKIEEIKEFFNSSKNVFKEMLKIKNQITNKYLNVYIKKLDNGFILIVDDITKFMNDEKIIDIIVSLNKKLYKSKDEKELFNNLIKILIKKGKFKDAIVVNYEKGEFKTIACSNEYLFDFFKNIDKNHPIAKVLENKEVFYNDDSRINKDVQSVKDKLLQYNFLSSVAIPIIKNNKVYAVLCIFQDEIDYFRHFKKLIEYIINSLTINIAKLEDLVFKDVLLNAINKGHEWVMITNKVPEIVFVNDTVEKITGYKKHELIGHNPKIFKSGLHNAAFYKEMWDKITKGKVFESVIINKTKDGKLFYLLDKIVPVGDFYISLGKDITNEKKYFHLIEELKYKDPITGLYNKDGFFKNAKEYLRKFKYESHILLIVDIYNFNAINHKYGIDVGDEVLKTIGKKLKNSFFERDLIYQLKSSNITLGRFNGDEFAIFLEKADDYCIPKILNKLYEIFNEEYKIKNEILKLDYNAGISIYPKDASNVDELLNHASVSLINAKKDGPNIVRIYSKEYSDEIYKFNETLSLIKDALKNNEFDFFYQPIVNTSDEKVVGAEALLRIIKKDGVILPGKFIDVLENSKYSLEVAMNMLDRIEEVLEKTDNVKISYNLCDKQFRNELTIEKLISIGKRFPDRLQVELIERVLIHEKVYSIRVLDKLKCNNITIAIDDFGTGYSSLSYIRELPVDVIKIDISFVRKMMQNPKDLAIVKTIINLAKELEIKTVAEGVEDEAQIAILKALGCDYLQGFYYYKPLPKDEFLKVLKS